MLLKSDGEGVATSIRNVEIAVIVLAVVAASIGDLCVP